MMVLGGGELFLMSEVNLYNHHMGAQIVIPLWRATAMVKGYFAHKKQTPPLGPPYEPRYSPPAES